MLHFRVLTAILKNPATNAKFFKDKLYKLYNKNSLSNQEWKSFVDYLTNNDNVSLSKLVELGLLPIEATPSSHRVVRGLDGIPEAKEIESNELPKIFRNYQSKEPNDDPNQVLASLLQKNRPNTEVVTYLNTLFELRLINTEFLLKFCDYCCVKLKKDLRLEVKERFKISDLDMLTFYSDRILNSPFFEENRYHLFGSWKRYQSVVSPRIDAAYLKDIQSIFDTELTQNCGLMRVTYLNGLENFLFDECEHGYIIFKNELFYKDKEGNLEYLNEIQNPPEIPPDQYLTVDNLLDIYTQTAHRLKKTPDLVIDQKLVFLAQYRNAVFNVFQDNHSLTSKQQRIIVTMNKYIYDYVYENDPNRQTGLLNDMYRLSNTLSLEGRTWGQKFNHKLASFCKNVFSVVLGLLGCSLMLGGPAAIIGGALLACFSKGDAATIALGVGGLMLGAAALFLGRQFFKQAFLLYKEPIGPGLFRDPKQTAYPVRRVIEQQFKKEQKEQQVAPTR